MRRIATLVILLALLGAGALVASTGAQGGTKSQKIDVIFDDARGLISGQQVKIAGAETGAITNVVVTSKYQARVEATVNGPFTFYKNATCIIRPDGLIAENYLDCDPGTAGSGVLKGVNGFPPTVPVSHTSEPVSIQDLFNIFNLPTRERFQVLIDELGITTAGNGDQINSILQRANPTLEAAQRVIAILDRQDNQIAEEIANTNAIAQAGVNHVGEVQSFIKQADGLTQLTADHSSSLEQAIDKLPGYLQASSPALKELNTVATDGTPLLASLHKAAPYLNKVDSDIVPFTTLAKPALAKLSTAISTVIPDAKDITPLVKTIGNYLQASSGTTAEFSGLIDNLIDHGFSENFLSVLYYVAGSLSKYDSDSHMLGAYLMFPDDGMCGTYATTVQPACDAHYGSGQAYTPAKKQQDRTSAASATSTTNSTTATPGATTTTPSSTPASSGASTSTNPVSGVVNKLGSTVANLGSSTSGAVNKVLNPGASTSSSSDTSTGSLSNLLNYLLK